MRVEFLDSSGARAADGALILFVFHEETPAPGRGELADDTVAALGSTCERSGFTGERDKTLAVAGVQGLAAYYAVLVGLGRREELTLTVIEDAAGRAYASLSDREPETVAMLLGGLGANEAAHAALGVQLAAYRFDRYHTVKPRKRPALLTVSSIVPEQAKAAYVPLAALVDGVCLARDLVSEPPNVVYPASFIERLRPLEAAGVKIEVLGEEEMAKLGMGALLAVGEGSARESQLAICTWRGADDRNAAPIALIGKGVTFDSGGLSLKPPKDMELMKQDMGGAAAVAGALLTLARQKVRANVVGVLGLVENMPDGKAARPGDIVTSMSGKTIEIVNTDAEGRLVLADALCFVQREIVPRAMIDLATLTGHASYGLGNDYASIMSNDDNLCAKIIAAGAPEGELMWRLPLVPAYDKLHDSPDADMKNVGGHPEAGAITAALFLQRFVENVPWAHMDIASVAWRTREDRPTLPKGATGFGVRTLTRLVADYFSDEV
jgi:leucyl aminopeptidase